VTPQDNNPKSLPTVSLLDDANNDGTVNASDKPLVNSDPGKVIFVSDDSTGTNANADHLAAMQISVTPDTSNGQTPQNTAGWTLTFSSSGGASTKIWDSLSKTNELDSGGQKTWTLSGNSFSQTVYVEQTSEGTFTNEVVLNDQAQTERGSTTAEDTANHGHLEFDSMKDVNGTSTPGKPLEAAVQKKDGVFVPVSNEDQTYFKDNDGKLKPDKDQTGEIKGDKFLLPFVVVADKLGGAYRLDNIGGGQIKIWKSADRGGGTFADDEAFNIAAGGQQKLYVEGISSGKFNMVLQWKNAQGNWVNSGDPVAINVFEFAGPQNVPNYSVYNYSIKGLANGVTGKWVDSTQSKLKSETNDSATVFWQKGANVGAIAYKINDNYTWDYYVNIVSITTKSPPAPAGAFPAQPGAGPQLLGDMIAPEPNTGIQSVGIFTAREASSLIKSYAVIDMHGPNEKTTVSAFGTRTTTVGWGVDQMVVGFCQVVTSVKTEADYGTAGKLDNVVNGGTYRDVAGAFGSEKAWNILNVFRHNDNTAPDTIIKGSSDTDSHQIYTSDNPKFAFPAFKEQVKDFAAGINPIKSVVAQQSFEINVCAGITDPTQREVYAVVDDSFTRLATAAWSVDASGDVTVNTATKKFTYKATAAKPYTPPAGWTAVNAGSKIDTTSKAYNVVASEYKWK
jgi:hypothetical protein